MKRVLAVLPYIALVLVIAAIGLRFQAYKGEWQEYSRPVAIAALVLTALYTLSQWREIGRSFQGREMRYGSLAAGSVLMFLAILTGLNWISTRQHKRWDLTANQQFSLSDQTRKVLGELKKPLVVKVFYESGPGPASLQAMHDRLDEYQYASKQVSIEYIDAVKDPVRTKSYDVQTYGTVVLEYDGRTERAAQADEQTLTNSLKKVIEGQSKKIYFVEGHGEHDTDGSERTGYSGFVQALKSDNFEVAKLALAQEGKVPDDATIAAIVGPKTDYLAPEVEALRAFLKKGGKVLLLLDPADKAETPALTNLTAFAKEWGIAAGSDLIFDQQSVQTPVAPVVATYPPHPITAEMNRVMTVFPYSRSVTPIDGGTDGKVAQKILETSTRSWAETDLKGLFANKPPAMNADQGDKKGPVPIGAAVSAAAPDAPAPATPDAPKPEARLIVVGDSDFASNSAITFQGNRDLALNMANWLAQQENLISIRPKDPQDRRIQLTEDQSERIFWLALFVIPGVLLATGVRVWWTRR